MYILKSMYPSLQSQTEIKRFGKLFFGGFITFGLFLFGPFFFVGFYINAF